MAGDSFTEVSSQGWLSRLGNAIKGVLIGLLLIVISFPILFWNEGRAVHTAQGLAEGAKSVISVGADKVDPANQGKLVHLSGLATTTEELKDPDFGVSSKALRLERTAEMYQWVEKKEQKKEKKLGGKEETITKYTYSKSWASRPQDSSNFANPEGHSNPPMRYQGKTESAKVVTVGAFQLSDSLANQISNSEPLQIQNNELASLPSDLKDQAKVSDGKFYLGKDPGDPQVGDERISFKVVKPTEVSILAKQVGQSFEPYQTSVSGSPLINRLQVGKFSAAEMFESAQAENTFLTWILRLVGYLLMAVGIGLLFQPLVVVADVIPLIGNMLQMGTFLFAGIIALPLTLITIAIGWIFYRPLLGIALLATAGMVLVGFYLLAKGRKADKKSG